MAPVKVPRALKQLKLLPHQTIDNWSEWVRDQAHGFKSWHSCEDPENFVEDEDAPAFVSIVSSLGQGPAELEYNPGTLLGNLFADIPDNGKTKIALIVPVQNISKEEAETLALPPANKQAKSLSSATISKQGGQGGRAQGSKKANVKKEATKGGVKEELDIKIKDNIKEDSNTFPKAYDILRQKRKNQLNSLYLAN
jgi:hypothetical protein